MAITIDGTTISGELTIDEEYGTDGVSPPGDTNDDDVASPSADFATFLARILHQA